MKIALVKLDVAVADLNRPVEHVMALTDGSDGAEASLLWVFNLATNLNGKNRSLRFWRPELLARVTGKDMEISRMDLNAVIANILPPSRTKFNAGEVDQLFQIRRQTRLVLEAELHGHTINRRGIYFRKPLEAFLTRRWIGATGGTGK